MNPVAQVTKAVRGRQTINPKTVLGFYATVLGLVLAATVSSVGVLAVNKVETNLILPLLIFCGALLVALLAAVFIISLLDPSKLMLTQVTGTEYAHIQQTLILGDSSRGDRVEVVPVLEAASTQTTSANEATSPEDVVIVEEQAGGTVVNERPLEGGK